ncbi:hypothetical protein B0H17DRAFT_1207805 [Mycena rosella]|uniref:Uncharacterized protein n=1 Tax=Mycena rosella TaxID=1033263 RepID=A0AAD7D2Q5_MYCRO|nr:hypothetical protein B0H17DRAFT_1207805 [Mycena rosella]
MTARRRPRNAAGVVPGAHREGPSVRSAPPVIFRGPPSSIVPHNRSLFRISLIDAGETAFGNSLGEARGRLQTLRPSPYIADRLGPPASYPAATGFQRGAPNSGGTSARADLWKNGVGPPKQTANKRITSVAYAFVADLQRLEHDWKCPDCPAEIYCAPFRQYAEEEAIADAYPEWNDESSVQYSWAGLVFPKAPRIIDSDAE